MNRLHFLPSIFWIVLGTVVIALFVNLPKFATGSLGVLSLSDTFSYFIAGYSLSDRIYFLPIYFGIFYLHPLGIPSGLPSLAVFLSNLILLFLFILSLRRYFFIKEQSDDEQKHFNNLIYFSGLFFFLHLLLALPVIIDSAGISVRHRIPSIFFLYISFLIMSGVRARIMLFFAISFFPFFFMFSN